MNVELYFEGFKIDLGEEISFPLTSTWENLANPTDIISDYSKQINIPCSDNNNKILGKFYDLDRIIAESGVTNTGIYFDATKKLPYELRMNGSVIMKGYAKVLSVTSKVAAEPQYQIKLFGTVGMVLSELSKLTFDPNTQDGQQYVIPDPIYPEIKLNADTVYHSWCAPFHQYVNDWTHWCGFAPTHQGRYVDFDSKSFQKNTEGVVHTFEEITNQHNGVEITDFGAMIGDGMTDRQFGEFRSYYQQPYIYIQPLFELLAQKGEELTGWKINLDKGWFNQSNPYWTDLVRICNKTEVESEIDDSIPYVATVSSSTEIRQNQWTDLQLKFNGTVPNVGADYTTTMSLNLRYFVNFELNPDSQDWYAKQQSSALWKTYIPIRFAVMNGTETVLKTDYIIRFPNCTQTFDGNFMIDVTKDNITASGSSSYVDISIDELPLVGYINKGYTIKASVWTNVPSYGDDGYQKMYIRQVANGSALVQHYIPTRSGRALNYNTIVQTDESFYPFKVLMEYVKMFGLVVDYDTNNQTINICDKNTYFKDYSIVDWSDKVDKTKDFVITPVTFDHKNILFDYKDVEGRKYTDYKDKYDVNYGGIRLVSSYDFDNEDEKIFGDNLTPLCVSSKVIHDWNRIYDLNFLKFVEKEKYIDAETIDGEPINLNGAYAFKCQNQKVDSRLRNINITDDTMFQRSVNNYMYLDVNELNGMQQYCARNEKTGGVAIDEIPLLNMTDDTNSYGCLFSKPTEIYTYDGIEGECPNWIYNLQWKKYIEERYSIQNKKLTCYVNIGINDWNQFKFNKLVKIDNQLYIVNKIYDYNPCDNYTTKVDLISIYDITAYLDGQNTWSYFESDMPVSEFASSRNTYYVKLNEGFDGFDFNLFNTEGEYTVINKPSWLTLTDDNGHITVLASTYGSDKNRVGVIVLKTTTNRFIIIYVEQVPTYRSGIETTTTSIVLKQSAMAVVGYTSLQSISAITSSTDWLSVRYDNANIYMTALNANTTSSPRNANVTIADIYGYTKVIKVSQPVQDATVKPDHMMVVTAGTAATSITVTIATTARLRNAYVSNKVQCDGSVTSVHFSATTRSTAIDISLDAMTYTEGVLDITCTDILNRKYYISVVRDSNYD